MVVAIAAVAVLVLSVRGVMTSAVLLGLAFVALLVIGLGLGHRRPSAARAPTASRRSSPGGRASSSWPAGCATAWPWPAGPARSSAALAFSAVAWTASTGTFLAAGQAVGVELSVAQAALLTSGVALVTIVPSGPGLPRHVRADRRRPSPTGFGIPRDPAFAIGLLVHVVILASRRSAASIAMLALRRRRDAAAGSAAAVPASRPAP